MLDLDHDQALFAVHGSQENPYTVTIISDQHWLISDCTCPYAAKGVICKHVVAAALYLYDQLVAHPPSIWRSIFANIQPPTRRRQNSMLLIFSLIERGASWTLVPYTFAERVIPQPVMHDPVALHKHLNTSAMLKHAKIPHTQLQPQQFPHSPEAALTLANMIVAFSQNYFYGITLQLPIILNALVQLLPDAAIFCGDDLHPFQRTLQVAVNRGQIQLHGTATTDGMTLTPMLRFGETSTNLDTDEVRILLFNAEWAIYRDWLVRYDDPGNILSLFRRHNHLNIPAADHTEFIEQYLVPLAEHTALSGDLPHQELVVADPQPRLYLSDHESTLRAELRFGYADHELVYDLQLPAETIRYSHEHATILRIQRQPSIEEQCWGELMRHGLKRGQQPSVATLRSGTTSATFLLNHVPKLAAMNFTIYGEESLLGARVNRHTPSITLRVSSGIDWFDLEAVVRFGETELELAELRRAIRKRKRYVKLADGTLGAIPELWLERYRHLFTLGEMHAETLRFAPTQITLLDGLLHNTDQVDPTFKQRLQGLKTINGIAPQPLPSGFAGVLRSYQKAGYDWLHFLYKYGFGGCLADDMGTGKTIQTLAFLQSLKARGQASASSLIVMPRSLIFNWQREIARWTPDLQVLVHTDQGRPDTVAAFSDYDLVLTTYGTLLRDIDLFATYQFHCLVLDEAQAIKNPSSQTARAARALHADHRLTLTGTPVENSILELWSQFAFLNPSMLGSLEHFRSEFATPIERDGDQQTAQLLRRMVNPFILRRTKDQVAPELPPRNERLMYCDMEPAQQKLYQRYRDQYRAMLLSLIDDQGINDSRIKVLEGLLRLRQICNHPQLVEATFRGHSAKFDQLLETLEVLHAEGHKALIFSQFVQMLTLLWKELDRRNLSYAYLDGKTNNRAAVVDRFQTDPQIHFFLISLKAGGVGLNLTAADYVIHIDPWWNPAVEQQATDRTHRIGQDKPVFIYKLIVRNSVEEKILQLQERKRALANNIITSEQGIVKSLTREDVVDLFS
ncbi:MAG TPA: serine/threonine protein kinase [Herpetosiphon sp.]|nr:serine/threonine protein kinase [Herpetosiphon sp.]